MGVKTYLTRSYASQRRPSVVTHRILAMSAPALLSTLLFASSTRAQDGTSESEAPPVMSGWLADLNAGAVRLESSDFRLAADARLGYGQGTWGIVASGAAGTYDETSDDAHRETERLTGGGEAWLLLGAPDASARLQLRATGGGAFYRSTYEPRTTAAGAWSDQDSWMGRGTLLVGVVWKPSERFLLDALAGGGVQSEWYDYVTVAKAQPVLIDDNLDITARGEARLELVWAAAPSILSLRLRGTASYFKLSRDNEFISAGRGPTSVETSRTTYSQLEASGRGFIDIDAAQVVGIRPTLHAGVDYVRLSGEGGDLATLVPVFGAGILHPWW